MELPVKEIVFDPGKNLRMGMFADSLVGKPAIEENSVFFNSVSKVCFAVNEEQRIIFGPVLIPDKLIYRNNNGEEFNLFATKYTIEKIAVDFMANNRQNNVNLDHQDDLVEGVIIFQSLVTNNNTVPFVKGWEHLPEGTLFHGAKVNNDEVWQGIKDGKYNGWSIHAFFEQQLVDMSVEGKIIDSILAEINNIN